jgi:hypothetical protein
VQSPTSATPRNERRPSPLSFLCPKADQIRSGSHHRHIVETLRVRSHQDVFVFLQWWLRAPTGSCGRDKQTSAHSKYLPLWPPEAAT